MTKTLTLNDGQQQAAEGFFQFLFDTSKELIISGAGGVGKTFLMGHLIDEIMPRYLKTSEIVGIQPEYDSVVMCATTNKAAEVLQLATSRPSQTIHSFLSLKVIDDFATGQSKLIKISSSWKVHTNKIIFIDECSMIDTNLRNCILEGTQNCKIIYVGDHCQLAPVMETLSPIYKSGLPFFNLTQSVRNVTKPDLSAICQQLRNTVETTVFGSIKSVPTVIDFLSPQEAQAEIDLNFLDPKTNNRILAYTNKRVVEFNDYIRELRQLPENYIVGETLINNSAVKIGKSMLSVEEEVTILDQGEAVLVNIAPNIDLEIIYSKIMTSRGIFTDIPIPVNKQHFTDLVKYFQKIKKWERYFYLKNTFPDLRQRDASTVHKSQGSTYDTVYIDMANLSTCNQPNLAARLLYVAFTRAKYRVVMFGDLAKKYGGIVC